MKSLTYLVFAYIAYDFIRQTLDLSKLLALFSLLLMYFISLFELPSAGISKFPLHFPRLVSHEHSSHEIRLLFHSDYMMITRCVII